MKTIDTQCVHTYIYQSTFTTYTKWHYGDRKNGCSTSRLTFLHLSSIHLNLGIFHGNRFLALSSSEILNKKGNVCVNRIKTSGSQVVLVTIYESFKVNLKTGSSYLACLAPFFENNVPIMQSTFNTISEPIQ